MRLHATVLLVPVLAASVSAAQRDPSRTTQARHRVTFVSRRARPRFAGASSQPTPVLRCAGHKSGCLRRKSLRDGRPALMPRAVSRSPVFPKAATRSTRPRTATSPGPTASGTRTNRDAARFAQRNDDRKRRFHASARRCHHRPRDGRSRRTGRRARRVGDAIQVHGESSTAGSRRLRRTHERSRGVPAVRTDARPVLPVGGDAGIRRRHDRGFRGSVSVRSDLLPGDSRCGGGGAARRSGGPDNQRREHVARHRAGRPDHRQRRRSRWQPGNGRLGGLAAADLRRFRAVRGRRRRQGRRQLHAVANRAGRLLHRRDDRRRHAGQDSNRHDERQRLRTGCDRTSDCHRAERAGERASRALGSQGSRERSRHVVPADCRTARLRVRPIRGSRSRSGPISPSTFQSARAGASSSRSACRPAGYSRPCA